MKILAFAASNNTQSINHQLVRYSVTLFQQKHEIEIIDLNEYDMPIFSPERLEKDGLPLAAQNFCTLVESADVVLISFAEYNGSYTPAFKNLLDWASTSKEKFWSGKNMILLSTSPGGRGAQTVLKQAVDYFPFMGAKILGSFSLPFFQKNFQEGKIMDADLDAQIIHLISRAESPSARVSHASSSSDQKFPRTIISFFEFLSRFWIFLGYGFFVFITLNAWFGAPLFPVTTSNIYWEIAMIAATFTLIIRPLYDLLPESDILRTMLTWRKGVGLISSGIVVAFFLSRTVSFTDPSIFFDYFTAEKWSPNLRNILERTTEITGITLFLISNKWMIAHANALWRQLQKLAYVYFLSAAFLLTIVHEKTYGVICLLLFFIIYQVWISKILFSPKDTSASSARRSQAS